jgi:hypothetical protein
LGAGRHPVKGHPPEAAEKPLAARGAVPRQGIAVPGAQPVREAGGAPWRPRAAIGPDYPVITPSSAKHQAGYRLVMDSSAHDIEVRALRLPLRERARLAQRLISSLDPESDRDTEQA